MGEGDRVDGAMIEEFGRYCIADLWPLTVDLERSRGMTLVTVGGRQVFDWTGFYGSKLLGHNHAHPLLEDPTYRGALLRAATNKTANPDYLTRECLDFYRFLHEVAPRCMRNPRLEVYTVNSGAEAVENMMKYLINLYDARHPTRSGPRRFIYFEEAFHGRTVYALNVTRLSANPTLTKDFHGLVAGNVQVPFPAFDADAGGPANEARARASLEAIEEALDRHEGEVVGIIAEPIQGAGGHRLAPPGFFRDLSELAHRRGIYLGLDEVQTAGGQCGDVFAADLLDLPHPPQAIAVAKKFGTGAVYMLESMDDRGVLDSTWGGHLVDMVRVPREFAVVRAERLVQKAAALGETLAEGLRALSGEFPGTISNVRGMGLYQGFSFGGPEAKSRFADFMLERESTLLLGAGPHSIRLRPPITASEEDVAELLGRMRSALSKLA
jgi:L-lysine 6-transaminase